MRAVVERAQGPKGGRALRYIRGLSVPRRPERFVVTWRDSATLRAIAVQVPWSRSAVTDWSEGAQVDSADSSSGVRRVAPVRLATVFEMPLSVNLFELLTEPRIDALAGVCDLLRPDKVLLRRRDA